HGEQPEQRVCGDVGPPVPQECPKAHVSLPLAGRERKPVAEAALRLDRVAQSELGEAPPETRDVHREGVVVDEVDVVPQSFAKRLPRYALAVPLGEAKQEPALLRRELHAALTVTCAALQLVQEKPLDAEHVELAADGVL